MLTISRSAECIALPHGTCGLQTGQDVANVLTDVAHINGSAVIFYPADDRDAQLSRLPPPLQTAITTRTGYARVDSDHQTRVDVQLVFKLPESCTLPPRYQLCQSNLRKLGTFIIIPPMIPPGTETFMFPAHRPHSPVAVDAGITNLPWQYAGLVVRAGTLRAKGPLGNEHTFMLACMLEKYASTLSVGYWAALDHAYTLSDKGYPCLQHLLPGERLRIRYWLQSLAHDCDDGDVDALHELVCSQNSPLAD